MAHIFQKSLLTTALIAVLALVSLPLIGPVPVAALTCAECREIEKNRRAYSEELEQKGLELKAAFDKRAYDKVTQINLRLSELRKQLSELSAYGDACEKACKPETVKAEECRSLKIEIGKLESEGGQSADHVKRIDELYKNLLRCNQELRRALGKED